VDRSLITDFSLDFLLPIAAMFRRDVAAHCEKLGLFSFYSVIDKCAIA
jgi:hypothetical protein